VSTSADPPALARPTNLRHLVLIALLVITSINYVQRNCIAPASTTIQADLHLDLVEIGAAMGTFFLFYTFAMVPSGMVAQWIGGKWALVLFASTWSLALALSALARDYAELWWARALMGILQAGVFPCATLILQQWYPASRRGLATALLNSFMLIGNVIGAAVTGRLLLVLNSDEHPEVWRQIFMGFAVPGLLWAVWFAWWFRNRPQDDPRVNKAELDLITGATPLATPPLKEEKETDAIRESDPRVSAAQDQVTSAAPAAVALPPDERSALVRHGRAMLFALAVMTLVLLYVQQGFRAGANRLFDMWMPTYYQQQRELSKETAAYLSAFLQAMGVVGGLAGGMLSDEVLRRTGSRRAARNGVALVGLLGGVVLYVAAYPLGNVYLATLVFGMGVFVFCFSSPCAYALTMDVGGRNLAIIFSLMNMIGNLGSWAFVTFTPRVVNWGERHWGEGRGWDLLMLVFVGMHLSAAVCWLFLDPKATVDDAFAAKPSE
jgi:ACS family glucarate transporter-like MFS transporter